MSPADAVTGALNCFGLLFLAFLAFGCGAAAWQTIEHRRVHRRLGLPVGASNLELCPRCMRDAEIKWGHWATWTTRDRLRKKLKRQEFD